MGFVCGVKGKVPKLKLVSGFGLLMPSSSVHLQKQLHRSVWVSVGLCGHPSHGHFKTCFKAPGEISTSAAKLQINELTARPDPGHAPRDMIW